MTLAQGDPALLDDEIVFGAYADSQKLHSLRANPNVAITIDTAGPPPDVLLLRGRAELGEVGGIVGEYAEAHRALDFQTRVPAAMTS